MSDRKRDSSNDSLPNYATYIEEKNTLFNRIKKLFTPKPKIFRLGNGESLEIDGTMPKRFVKGFFTKLGAGIATIASKPKEFIEAAKVKNTPEVYSTSLSVTNKKKQHKKETSLLGEGMKFAKDSEVIIPVGPQETAKTISYVETTLDSKDDSALQKETAIEQNSSVENKINPFSEYNKSQAVPQVQNTPIIQDDNELEK